MVWRRSTVALLCGLGLACGPEGVAAPDTDSESDTETSGTTGDGGSASVSASASASASAGSMSGSATTTAGNDDDDDDAADGTTEPEVTSADDAPPDTTDTGECPFGAEGCLCDVGAMCDEGLECDDRGLCVAPPSCPALDEDPHADEASAYPVDSVTCGNANDLGVIATLVGPETDWYAFGGEEVMFCPEQPAAAVAADVVTEVCVFIECVDGEAENVNCADGSNETDSPEGRPGCCGENETQIAGYGCSGPFSGQNVNAWISVSTTEETCTDYALSYAI